METWQKQAVEKQKKQQKGKRQGEANGRYDQNRIIDTADRNLSSQNEMEQDWEEEDYNDFEEEQVFLKEMI